MMDIFAREPGLLIVFVALVCGTLIAVSAILCHHWSVVRQAETEASLKQDMLNRGLSVDEIERVIKASAQVAKAQASADKPDPISDNEYYLVEKLVDEGKSAEEIERIIRACKTLSESSS